MVTELTAVMPGPVYLTAVLVRKTTMFTVLTKILPHLMERRQ